MGKINFTIDKVKGAIEKAKALTSGGGGSDDYTNVAYLPEGNHTIRWFFDPNGEITRLAVMHSISGKRTLCPDWLKKNNIRFTVKTDDGKEIESLDYPECKICKMAADLDNWRLNPRYNHFVYGYLYATDTPGDYWKPNKAYCIIGSTKMGRAIINSLEALVKDSSDWLMSMLNPQLAGGLTNVNVVKGQGGSVAITPVPGKDVDPITLGEWWRPLGEVYVPAIFDLDIYETALRAFNLEWYEDAFKDFDFEALDKYIQNKGLKIDTKKHNNVEDLKKLIVETEKIQTTDKGKSATKKNVSIPMPEEYLKGIERNALLIRIRDEELGITVYPRFTDDNIRTMIWTMECQAGLQPAQWEKETKPKEEVEVAKKVEETKEVAEKVEEVETPKEPEKVEEVKEVAEKPENPSKEDAEKIEEEVHGKIEEVEGKAPEGFECKGEGWGKYNPAKPECIVCSHNIDCMSV